MSEVTNIGEYRMSRKRDESWFLKKGECPHKRLTSDDRGEIVTCDDCDKQVSAFWAMTMLAKAYESERSKLDRMSEKLKEDQSASIHLTAARLVEKAWRSKSMVPACPHCSRGILVSDGLGASQVNKTMELQRRHFEKAKS